MSFSTVQYKSVERTAMRVRTVFCVFSRTTWSDLTNKRKKENKKENKPIYSEQRLFSIMYKKIFFAVLKIIDVKVLSLLIFYYVTCP